MNVMYIVNDFPKLSESFIINEIYELENRGHDVSVFATNGLEEEEEVTHKEIEEMDLTIYNAEQPSFQSLPDLFTKRVLNLPVLQRAAFLDSPLYHAYCLHLGRQIIESVEAESKVDLIHAHFATPNRLAVSYAAAYHDIPCTVTAHAYEIFSDPDFRRLQRVCSRFDHVIVPSEYNKRYLKEEVGNKTDISVVPATTDVEKFQPSDGCLSGRLLTVARLVEKKGHEYAIDAVAELVKQGYDPEYHIVGTGERKEFLQNRVREQDLEDHIKFLEHISDEKLQKELNDAEVFILPCVIASDGDRDVAPVALKEAMATETACISTSISAIPELITDGHDGILIKPNDSRALADAIAEILDNPHRRQELAKNGRKTVRTKFDISKSVSELVDVFYSVK